MPCINQYPLRRGIVGPNATCVGTLRLCNAECRVRVGTIDRAIDVGGTGQRLFAAATAAIAEHGRVRWANEADVRTLLGARTQVLAVVLLLWIARDIGKATGDAATAGGSRVAGSAAWTNARELAVAAIVANRLDVALCQRRRSFCVRALVESNAERMWIVCPDRPAIDRRGACRGLLAAAAASIAEYRRIGDARKANCLTLGRAHTNVVALPFRGRIAAVGRGFTGYSYVAQALRVAGRVR